LQQQSDRPLDYRPSGLPERFGPTVFALVLLVLTIFFTVNVVSTPWLDYLESSTTYYLVGFCDHSGCHDYAGLNSPFRDVFPQTYGLGLIALALAGVELVFLVLSIFGKRVAFGILFSGILSSSTLLLAALYFYFGVLVKMSREPWATGRGWFAAFLVVSFLLMATIIGFFAERARNPALASRD